MNIAIQLEDRVSRSRSKHEGESSAEICDRLSRTRVSSQRQLPTDHDYAVPTREYQLDQSSPLPATATADPVLEKTSTKPPQPFEDVDRVTPYQFPIGRLPARSWARWQAQPIDTDRVAADRLSTDLYRAATRTGQCLVPLGRLNGPRQLGACSHRPECHAP